MGRFYHSSDGFLRLCVQKLERRTNINLSKSKYTIFIIYYLQGCVTLENSADPDEMPYFMSSHLGLHCLYMFPF